MGPQHVCIATNPPMFQTSEAPVETGENEIKNKANLSPVATPGIRD
jgi:hypothetical protein